MMPPHCVFILLDLKINILAHSGGPFLMLPIIIVVYFSITVFANK